MAQEVVCPKCQKRYSFAAEMAGKRVRCRQCTEIFTITLTPPSLEADDGVMGIEEASAATASMLAPSDPPNLGGTSVGGASESQFEQAFQSEAVESDFRPNTRFKFPWAAQLDEWLPIAIVVIGVIWMSWATFRAAEGPALPAWTALLRLTIVFGLFLALSLPAVMFGARRIAAKLKYNLPPAPGWRAGAVFTLPLMLSYVLWVTTGSIGNLVVGIILGLGFGAAAFWLLFRLEPKELGPSYAAASGGFVASVIASAIIMVVINATLNAAMKSSNAASALPGSPLGPSFTWNAPPPPAQQLPGSDSPDRPDASSQLASKNTVNPKTTPRTSNTEGTSPAGSDSATASAHQSAPDGTTASHDVTDVKPQVTPTSADLTQSTADPAGHAQPSDATPRTGSSSNGSSDIVTSSDSSSRTGATSASNASSKREGGPTVFDLPPDAVEPHGHDDATGTAAAMSANSKDAWISGLRDKALPFVKNVQAANDIGPLDEVIYPATRSHWMAVVRHKDARDDVVECRDSRTFELAGTAPFARESLGGMSGRKYVLSPDGTLLARPSRFPNNCFPVWSFKEQRNLCLIEPGETARSMELFGFLDNDRLLMFVIRQVPALEIWNVRTNKRMATFPAPNYMHSIANGEISPDGKLFALAARVPIRRTGEGIVNQPELLVYNLSATGTGPRQLPIARLDARWAVLPAGIAFSPDCTKVATIFAQGSEGFIACWNLKDHGRENDQVCPGVPVQLNRVVGEGGRAFDWLGNDAWVVAGDVVMDSLSGRLLGNLAADTVKNQRLVADDRLQLLYNANNTMRVASVQIDPAKLSDKN